MIPHANPNRAASLLTLLGTGAAAARTSRDLADALGVCALDWRREITKAVQALRRRGIPVCANKNPKAGPLGYFLAATEAEVRGLNQRRRAEGLAELRPVRDTRGQQSLFGEAA